jgi:hypothetical protein
MHVNIINESLLIPAGCPNLDTSVRTNRAADPAHSLRYFLEEVQRTCHAHGLMRRPYLYLIRVVQMEARETMETKRW